MYLLVAECDGLVRLSALLPTHGVAAAGHVAPEVADVSSACHVPQLLQDDAEVLADLSSQLFCHQQSLVQHLQFCCGGDRSVL